MIPAVPTILYEDNHLLVVNKPVGLPTMGVEADRPSLIAWAKEDLRLRYEKPGNVYLGIVSRLDTLVSGVVVIAKTSKAASRLTEQFRQRTVEKIYWGLVEPSFEPAAGELRDWVYAPGHRRAVRSVAADRAGARDAVLEFRRLVRLPRAALVEIRPHTGRKHQIRVQFSQHGFPLLGDRKYGSRRTFPAGIALHARRLTLRHPVRDETLSWTAPLPAYWSEFGVRDDAE
ncbi:MAG: RluA family pseudouridine synthase [Pirellulales bacterium]|nr:RluA family pseudouridine synthase [Pirellulales bacterium]